MATYEQQQKEIEPIRPRSLILNLSDADYRKIAEKAATAELTLEELLEGWIGDLVWGMYSHGSDERDLANQWFDRCDFSHYNPYSFLHYVIAEDLLDEFVEAWLDFNSCKDEAEKCKKELENPVEDWRGCTFSDGSPCYATLEQYLQDIKDDYESFTDDMNDAAEYIEKNWNEFLKWTHTKEPNKEDEIAAVIEWYSKYVANTKLA